MRIPALLLLSVGALEAQSWFGPAREARPAETVWEQGRPVAIGLSRAFETRTAPRVEHPAWGSLPMPAGIGGFVSLRSRDGVLWVFGDRAHPATERASQVSGWGSAPADRILLRSMDGRRWEIAGQLRTHRVQPGGPPFPVADSARSVEDLVPLGDGAFLAWGRFLQEGRASFFARYRADGRGLLQFERLVELPVGWDASLAKPSSLPKVLQNAFGAHVSWRIARSPRGILCLHRESSLAVLLDNEDGRILESRVLLPGHPWEAETRPWNQAVLDVQPLADGSFLVATPDLSFARTRVPMPLKELQEREARARITASTRLAQARLFGRVEDTRVPEAIQTLHWYRYQPGMPLQTLAPPKDFPRGVVSFRAYQMFSFTFRPDGGLVLGPGLEARGTVVR